MGGKFTRYGNQARGAHVYRAAMSIRLLFGFLICVCTYFFFRDFATEEWWRLAILAAFAIAALMTWPSTIITNADGVEEHRWWRPPVSVRWADITAIEETTSQDIVIHGADGRIIRAGRIHKGRARLRRELSRWR